MGLLSNTEYSIVEKYIKRKIYHLNHFQVDNSVALSTFAMLMHPSPSSLPKLKLSPRNTTPPPPQLLAAAIPLSVSEFDDSPSLSKWDHIVCVLLCLTYFTEHDVLESIHVVACIGASFLFKAG